ncbi:MAG: Enoyl-CoA hydratase [uncultured Corynebacteriales bacterium]|uniref:Enoyl-CoA hydratase n=1 Tax=uncultured Mycobacteriales bacterium TaxID=581187 RepID=A0A6J4HRZ3_9ACTN|nr:MAG: Enoyl-CoA hydratase [uncultured Corynebacteriales bacterium]
MDDYQQITYDVADRIATVSLNRPEARNAFTTRMAGELVDAFDRADADDEVGAVVFTAAGPHFCTGLDLSDDGLTDAGGPGWEEPAGRCSLRVFRMNKPVIAAVRGAAVGAGSTIVLSADYRLAATDTKFGFVFSRRGIYAEGASTWFLPRLVGIGTALDWLVSGRAFDAEEALAAGLAHSVHQPDDLLPRARELAAAIIARTAPVSVAVIRQMVWRMSPLDSPEPVHRLDSRLAAAALTSADAKEGFASFAGRRDPAFPGTVGRDLPDFLPWAGSDDGR